MDWWRKNILFKVKKNLATNDGNWKIKSKEEKINNEIPTFKFIEDTKIE
jgi:hypothetical protein